MHSYVLLPCLAACFCLSSPVPSACVPSCATFSHHLPLTLLLSQAARFSKKGSKEAESGLIAMDALHKQVGGGGG